MPNVVKGSKQEKMVVVPHRPYRRAALVLAALSVVAVSVLAGLGYGYYSSLQSQTLIQSDRAELTRELEALRQENADLQREVAVLQRSSQVDRRANDEVQATLSSLRQEVAKLQQDNAYYRQVVSEKTEGTGLVIGQFDISTLSAPNRYRYKLVLRQEDADGDTYLTGHANVNLIGRVEDEEVSLPLSELTEDEEQLDIKLRFKYFQNIEGELALPDGFEPERVQIAAVSTEPVDKSVEQDFGWIVEGK